LTQAVAGAKAGAVPASGGSPRPLTSYERLADREVRRAIEDGRFDELPGFGRPLPGIDEPHDDLWWLRKKLREEEVEVLPPSLMLRREVEQLLARTQAAPSEQQAGKLIDQANTKIRRANRLGIAGPPHNLSPYDPAPLLERWRQAHQAPAEPAPVDPAAARPGRSRRRWWRREGGPPGR
jgi:hypothetical protein